MTYFGPAIIDIAVCVEDEKIDLIYFYEFHQIDVFFYILNQGRIPGHYHFGIETAE